MVSAMNREFVEMALAQVERHVARGEIIIARQRATIVAAERIGRDVALCKEFLSVFEESQRLHIAHRDRLRKDMENAYRPGHEAPSAGRVRCAASSISLPGDACEPQPLAQPDYGLG
jgi:hypothetical protein